MEHREGNHVQRREAELALERAATDAAWLTVLRDTYQGRHDVLDALWWVAHPLTAAPSGATDPAAELRAQQRAVFSRAGLESPLVEVVDPKTGTVHSVRESELRLQDAQRRLDEDAAHLREALAAVTPKAEPGEQSVEQPVDPVEGDLQASTGSSSPVGSASGDAGASTLNRRKLVITTAAALGLVAVIATTSQLANVEAGLGLAPTATPTIAPAPPATEIVEIGYSGKIGDPYEYLSRPYTAVDEPPFGHMTAGSSRMLPDLVWHADLYLGLQEPDSICLTVAAHEGQGMGICIPEAVFETDGLFLNGDGGYAIRPDMEIIYEEFRLSPDGEFTYRGSARATLSGEPLEGY